MIEAYQKAGGVINKEHVVAAIYGSFSWIGWLVYNIERSCVSDDSEHKNVGIEQVNQTLATILRLQRLMPEVIKIIEGNMTNTHQPFNIIPDLAHKLIAEQFPEYAHLPITSVEKQGHDNRTYRLGPDMLIRMPTAESYALKVPKEQELLPQLAKYLSLSIWTLAFFNFNTPRSLRSEEARNRSLSLCTENQRAVSKGSSSF